MAASSGQGELDLSSVLAACRANLERQLHGELPDLVSNSIADLAGPTEKRQGDLPSENQRMMQDITRMCAAHAKDNMETGT